MAEQPPNVQKPITKCHSQRMCDALVRQGWTLRTEFRSTAQDEPYEYILVWAETGSPPARPQLDRDGST
jgi:hypothetical protein